MAEGDAGPPGPIPNPVVKRISASGYCGSNAVGDAAAAGGPHPTLAVAAPSLRIVCHRCQRSPVSIAILVMVPIDEVDHPSRGGAAAARRAHNPKVGGSNPPPATK